MNDKALIQNLYDKVKWLREPEFGDFKRKVGLYLEKAREDLDSKRGSHQDLLNNLDELKFQVVYAPNGDIEATRALVLSKLLSLGASGK